MSSLVCTGQLPQAVQEGDVLCGPWQGDPEA
jgi:hypothetical protein